MVWFAVYYGTYEPQCGVSIRSISCSDVDIYKYDKFTDEVSFFRYKFTLLYGKTKRAMDPISYMHRRHKPIDLSACLRCVKILTHMKYLNKCYSEIVTKHKLNSHTHDIQSPGGFVGFIKDVLSNTLASNKYYITPHKHYVTTYDVSILKRIADRCTIKRRFGGWDTHELTSYPPRYVKAMLKSINHFVNPKRLLYEVRESVNGIDGIPCPRYYLSIFENYIQ